MMQLTVVVKFLVMKIVNMYRILLQGCTDNWNEHTQQRCYREQIWQPTTDWLLTNTNSYCTCIAVSAPILQQEAKLLLG